MLGVGAGVSEVEVVTFWKNSASVEGADDGVGVGVEVVVGAEEVEGGITVDIVSPIRTYLPFLSPS